MGPHTSMEFFSSREGVIVSATFKLYPLTAESRTVLVELPSVSALGTIAGKFLSSHLTPTSLEFATHPLRVMARFESIAESVEQQSTTAENLIRETGLSPRTVSGEDEQHLWSQHASATFAAPGALLKVSVLPAQLADTLGVIERLAGSTEYIGAGRAGLGVFVLFISGEIETQKRVIGGLRQSLPGSGSAVLIDGSTGRMYLSQAGERETRSTADT
jgi:FAD/FMN-containing dehydrogenase